MVTGLQMVILGGLLASFGLVVGVRALRPAVPSLSAALEQLAAEPTVITPVSVSDTDGHWNWLPAGVAVALDSHLGVSNADLAIIGWTRTELAARKVTLALGGFLIPSVMGVLLALLGLGAVAVFPVVIAFAVAAVGWLLPSQEARELAGKARVEFRTNLEFFLTLVAGERRARGSVEQALGEASEVSGSMPFVRMRQAIRRATWAGRKPWADLRALG